MAQEQDRREAILEAAFDCAGRFGIARMTMSDVAAAAKLSRQTVYRYFPTKHALLGALVVREDERLVQRVRIAVKAHTTLHASIEAGVLASLEWMREHPLLDPLMKAEPEELLPYLTVEAHPLLAIGRRTAEAIFRERLPKAPPERIRAAAETFARVMQSYAITPPAEEPEDVARALADLFADALARYQE